MSKRTMVVVVVLGALVLGAAASGSGRWLAQKIRVMHGGQGGRH